MTWPMTCLVTYGHKKPPRTRIGGVKQVCDLYENKKTCRRRASFKFPIKRIRSVIHDRVSSVDIKGRHPTDYGSLTRTNPAAAKAATVKIAAKAVAPVANPV